MKIYANLFLSDNIDIQSTIEQFDEAALLLNAERKVIAANNLFLKMFHFNHSEIRELSFLEIVNNKWNMKVLSEKLSVSAPVKAQFYEQHHFNGIGTLNLEISINRIDNEKENLNILILRFKKK